MRVRHLSAGENGAFGNRRVKVGVLVATVTALGMGSAALLANSQNAHAQPANSNDLAVAPMPTILGKVTDQKAAQLIETASAKFAALNESIVAPNTSGTTNWPSAQSLLPPSSGTIVAPLTDAGGNLYIDPAAIKTMVAQATGAMLSVATVNSESTWWIQNALESQSGHGFQVTSAGAYPTVFRIDSQTSSQAVVTTRVTEWQNQVYPASDTTFKTHSIRNQAIWTLTLVLDDSGQWKVDSTQFRFVPNEGP